MRPVEFSDLVPGSLAEREYYDAKGELLLSKGVKITERHLAVLRRRGVAQLFVREATEEEKIRSILSRPIEHLGDISLVDDELSSGPVETGPLPQALALSDLRAASEGPDGMRALVDSPRTSALDRRISAGRRADQPCGPPLRDRSTEMAVAERTDIYKKDIGTSYREALADVRRIHGAFSEGHHIDGDSVRGIVKHFIRTFITDRNILLNISNVKSDSTEYLHHHSLNVCLVTINIAAAHGYSEEQVEEIGMGALLHDIGMTLVPEAIRHKPGRLTEDEWFEIQKHPIIGLHLLERASRLPESVQFVAYQTHERENGKGYPKQRTARFIHNYARIVQVADIFDAVSSPRPYRKAYMPYAGVEMLIKMTRTGLVAGEFVRALLCYTSLFPVGSVVELNDGRLAKVIKPNGTSFAKPTVSILTDSAGNPLPPSGIYQESLYENTDLHITRAFACDAIARVGLMDGF